jgi:transcriptional regulator with XRE-family HTH domain
MNHEIEHIATAIKDARTRQGVSQRELSANSGVPQAQISKFENGSVDLRLSSLVALARALGLELELIPRKAVPAVKSIVRSTAQPPTIDLASLARAQAVFERFQKTVQGIDAPFKEISRLQDSLRALEGLRIPAAEASSFERLVKQVEQANRTSTDLEKLLQISDKLQSFRNHIAHASSRSDQNLLPRPAYSIDDEGENA